MIGGNMELNDLIMIGLGAVGSLLMWLLIGPLMSGKGLSGWIKSASRNKTKSDQMKRESLFMLFDLLLIYGSEHKVKTGKRIKIPSGDIDEKEKPIMIETEEILTPMQIISRTMGNEVMVKVKGMMGGKQTQMQNAVSEAMAQSGGDPRAMIPIALQSAAQGNYGPAVAVILQIVSSKKDISPNQGGFQGGI